jgi:hypothetical protein
MNPESTPGQEGRFAISRVLRDAWTWSCGQWESRPKLRVEVEGPDGRHTTLTFWGHLALSGTLIVAGGLFYGAVFVTVSEISSRWRICLPQPQTSAEATAQSQDLQARIGNMRKRIGSLSNAGVTMTVTPGQTERLLQQVRQLDQGQRLACTVGVFFFSHRYAALSLSTAAGIAALGSLALISKQGWAKSNNLVINLGITSALTLYTAWTFSQLYGQAANYENYSKKYVLAHDLITTIDSAIANGSAVITTNQESSTLNLASKPDMAKLISHVDEGLKILNRPEFSGDSTFAEDSFETIGGILKPGTPHDSEPEP